MSEAGLDTAARMVAHGLDGYQFLRSQDPLEQRVMVELLNRAVEERERLDHNQAVNIAVQVRKTFK